MLEVAKMVNGTQNQIVCTLSIEVGNGKKGDHNIRMQITK